MTDVYVLLRYVAESESWTEWDAPTAFATAEEAVAFAEGWIAGGGPRRLDPAAGVFDDEGADVCGWRVWRCPIGAMVGFEGPRWEGPMPKLPRDEEDGDE